MLINRCLSFYCTPTQMLPNRHPLFPNFGPVLDPVSTFIFRRGLIPVWGLEVAILSACATAGNRGGGASGIGFAERNAGTCRLRERKRFYCRSMTSHTCHLYDVSMDNACRSSG